MTLEKFMFVRDLMRKAQYECSWCNQLAIRSLYFGGGWIAQACCEHLKDLDAKEQSLLDLYAGLG